MNDLTIRRAVSSDAQRVVQLRLLLQKHIEKSNPLIWRITKEGRNLLKQNVKSDIANDDIRILLAEANGETVGIVQGEVTCRSDHMPRIVGHVSLMYVMKGFRRRGIGKLLMKELCEFLRSRGTENLTVRYVIGNVEAESFWRKLEFESIITTGSASLGELDLRLKSLIDQTNS